MRVRPLPGVDAALRRAGAQDAGLAVAVTGPAVLVTPTRERAAWHGRAPESWEHLMTRPRPRTSEPVGPVGPGERIHLTVPTGTAR